MTIVVGMLVTLYTMLGGIQAVIWNDVVQFCIMFGGLAATVVIVLVQRARRLRRDLERGGRGRQAGPVAAAGAIRRRLALVDQVVSFFAQPMNASWRCWWRWSSAAWRSTPATR